MWTLAQFLTLSLVLLAAPSGWGKERALIIYSPHGPEILRLAKEEFYKIAPTVDVDWQFMGAESVHDKVVSEGGNSAGDVWWGGPQFMFANAAKAEALIPFEPSWSANVDSAFRDAKHRWYGDQQVPLTIVFDETQLKLEGAPKDWDDLLSPELKGKLVIRHPLGSGTMVALFSAMIDRQLESGKSLDEALDWVKRLNAQVGRYVEHSQGMFAALGKSLYRVGLWNVPDTSTRRAQGYPVGFVFPTSGMPILLDCIAILKRTTPEHPAARRFYEMVTSAEFATRLAAEPFQRIPTRRDVPKKARPDYLDDLRFKRMQVNWERVGESSKSWLKAWQDATKAAVGAH